MTQGIDYYDGVLDVVRVNSDDLMHKRCHMANDCEDCSHLPDASGSKWFCTSDVKTL